MRITLAAAVLLAGITSCKKKSEAVDAGTKNEIASYDLGFHLDLLPNWVLDAGDRAKQDETIVGEAHRRPPGSKPYLVAPRIIVTVLPGKGESVDQLAEATLEDLKRLELHGGVRVNRTAMSVRVKDGVMIGDLEVSYSVLGDKRDRSREVVHRSIVTKRSRMDGSDAALTLTATFLADDSEAVSPEVYQMFAGLGFDDGPGARSAGPSPRIVAHDAEAPR
jgi:hypothetical protein